MVSYSVSLGVMSKANCKANPEDKWEGRKQGERGKEGRTEASILFQKYSGVLLCLISRFLLPDLEGFYFLTFFVG